MGLLFVVMLCIIYVVTIHTIICTAPYTNSRHALYE